MMRWVGSAWRRQGHPCGEMREPAEAVNSAESARGGPSASLSCRLQSDAGCRRTRDRQGPLAHPDQPERLGARPLLEREAAAIIGHVQHHLPVDYSQSHVNLARVRVAHDVRKRFLQDPLDHRPLPVAEGRELIGTVKFDGRAGMLDKLPQLRLDGRFQVELIEDPFPKIRREGANNLDGLVDQRLGCFDLFALRRLRIWHIPGQRVEVYLQGGQRLPQSVVHRAGHGKALVLSHVLKLDGEIA